MVDYIIVYKSERDGCLPARELEVLLGLVLAEGRDAREEGAALDARLGQDEQEGAAQRQVAEQELQVPKDAVRDRLQGRNATNQ